MKAGKQRQADHGNWYMQDHMVKTGAMRLSAEAQPRAQKLLRESSLLKRQNRNLQAKEFLLAQAFGLSLINPQTHNKRVLMTVQKTGLEI